MRIDPRVERPRRFLVLSDAHLRALSHRTYRRIARAARWAAANGATHALLAGDLLDDDREVEVVAERLRHALGRLAALYVSGNHESARYHRWSILPAERGVARNDVARIERAMAAHGIARIDDRMVDLDGLPLLGVGWRGWRLGPGPLAPRRLAEAAGPALVLAHSPDHVVGLPPQRVLLALCGHTHGGQVRLPGVGAPWMPVRSRLPRVAGAMTIAGVPTYVGRGIGATIPIRLGSVPEAILVDVRADERDRVPIDTTSLVTLRTARQRR
ncbi:MAG: metallophosphoesterase [Chloroflexota bacterium]|nr:metallophosphoesterase [Chloroflexota bacterium]MDE3194420.1 metallophosphoesterase [Chloroflexota bacterium]